jgi:hypothetical protein
MKLLRIVEVYCYSQWFKATYRSRSGRICDITFSKHFNSKKGETHALTNAKHDSVILSLSDPLWAEIQTAIQQHQTTEKDVAMAHIEITWVKGYQETMLADYITDEGEAYQLVFTSSYNNKTHSETHILHEVSKGCVELSNDDPIWKEVVKALNKKSPRRSRNSEQGHSKA